MYYIEGGGKWEICLELQRGQVVYRNNKKKNHEKIRKWGFI